MDSFWSDKGGHSSHAHARAQEQSTASAKEYIASKRQQGSIRTAKGKETADLTEEWRAFTNGDQPLQVQPANVPLGPRVGAQHDGQDVVDFLASPHYTDAVETPQPRSHPEHVVIEDSRYLTDLFASQDIVEYLAHTSYTDDVYGLPPQLLTVLNAAKQESQPSNPPTTKSAVRRLEMLRRHLQHLESKPLHINDVTTALDDLHFEDAWHA